MCSHHKDPLVDHSCPRCGERSYSVAAMSCKGMQVIEKEGDFMGSGAAVGLGGIGMGVGGGTYSEEGSVATKFSSVFREPEFFPKSRSSYRNMSSFIYLLPAPLVISMLVKVFESISGEESNIFIDTINISGFMLIGVLILSGVVYLFNEIINNEKKNKMINALNEKNRLIHDKMLNNYNKMRYCEYCHILFSPDNGDTEFADKSGFEKLLRKPELTKQVCE